MSRAKSDWLLIAVGGLLGAFVGLAVAFFAMWQDGPGALDVKPFDFVLSYTIPPDPNVPARLSVEVFGTWRYSRQALDYHDFDAEVEFIRWVNFTPGVLVMGLLFALGVQAGAIAGRWARRRRDRRVAH